MDLFFFDYSFRTVIWEPMSQISVYIIRYHQQRFNSLLAGVFFSGSEPKSFFKPLWIGSGFSIISGHSNTGQNEPNCLMFLEAGAVFCSCVWGLLFCTTSGSWRINAAWKSLTISYVNAKLFKPHRYFSDSFLFARSLPGAWVTEWDSLAILWLI